jgi:spermidine synthase
MVRKWVQLGVGSIPGGGEMRLMQRGDEFSIMLGTSELMNSRRGNSEEALAQLTCARLADRPARVLIGGLGMGFTLRAALALLGPAAQVEVVELVPAVLEWARGPMAAVFDGCLEDPRLSVRQADVGAVMAGGAGAYDAILLDVDNGPDGLTRASNDRLYGSKGLAVSRAALRQGGVLAVWSSGRDAAFTQRLKRAQFAVEEVTANAHGKGGPQHVIWLGTNG